MGSSRRLIVTLIEPAINLHRQSCCRGIASRECLSKFIIFGKRHLDHLISEFTTYYNTARSHMERENLPPVRNVPDEV